MKLKIFDKIILVIIMLVLIALSAGAIFLVWFRPIGEPALYLNAFLNGNIVNNIVVTALAVLLIFFCFRILFVRKRRPYEKEEVRPAAPGILIRNGEAGTSFLSVEALEGMIHKFTRSNSKVRDCQIKVFPGDDDVSVNMKIITAPEVVIPEFTDELQSSLKAYIENMTGIKVRDIQVLIAPNDGAPNVANKPRVE